MFLVICIHIEYFRVEFSLFKTNYNILLLPTYGHNITLFGQKTRTASQALGIPRATSVSHSDEVS